MCAGYGVLLTVLYFVVLLCVLGLAFLYCVLGLIFFALCVGLALISTGIGAFVVLLGVAVSASMKWSESSSQASKNLKMLSDVNKEANKNIEDERAELTKLVAIAKNERMILKYLMKTRLKQILSLAT